MQNKFISKISLIASFTLAISACLDAPPTAASELMPTAFETAVSDTPTQTVDTQPASPTEATVQNLILNHNPDLSGNIGSGGEIYHLEVVGDRTNNITSQAFLTFELPDLPFGATIMEVGLDLSDYVINGDPFEDLGCLRAYVDRFDEVDSVDYVVSASNDFFFQWCNESELIEQHRVQALIEMLPPEDDPTSFQVRLQFENTSDEDGRVDALEILNALLHIVFIEP